MFSDRGTHRRHFRSSPEEVKEREAHAVQWLYCRRRVRTGWMQIQGSSRGNSPWHSAWHSSSAGTEKPFSWFPMVPFFRALFIQRVLEANKKGYSSATSHLQVSQPRRQWAYLPASSGGSESLRRMAAPCSLLLVLLSEYSFFKHFLISRSRSLQWPKNFRMLWFLWHSFSRLIRTLHSSVCKCGDKSGCIVRRASRSRPYHLSVSLS